MHKLIVNFNNTNRYWKKINNTNVHLRETTIKTTETKANKNQQANRLNTEHNRSTKNNY